MQMLIEMRRFLKDEQGQDLVEFSLLLAFVMFTVVGFGGGFQLSFVSVAGTLNSTLAAAGAAIRLGKTEHFGNAIR
jgi:Flp pilus assembly pilin Flp